MQEQEHVHDCTSPDMTCPCGFVFRVPPISVSIEVFNRRRELVNVSFNCESVEVAVDALRDAAAQLERRM